MWEEENILINQLEQLKVAGQLLNHTILYVVPVEKSALELFNEIDNNIFKNSSMSKYHGVVIK